MKNKKYILSVILFLFVFSGIAQEKTMETLQKNVTSKSTFFEIEAEANKLWGGSVDHSKLTKKEQKSYKKYQRWKAFWENRLDENGGFSGPAKAVAKESKARRVGLSSNTTSQRTGGEVDWAPIGPYGIDEATGTGTGIPLTGGIGAIHAVAYDPYDPTAQTIYAASNMGGLFKTTNGGEYWWNISDNIVGGTSYVGYKNIIVAKDVNQNKVIYASATGHNYNGMALRRLMMSRGVMRSYDEGASWNNLTDFNSTLNVSPFKLDFESDPDFGGKGRSIAEMKLHPNGNLYMLVVEGLDDLSCNCLNTKLYESIGGGNSWTLLQTFTGEIMHQLEVLPSKPNIFFIAGVGGLYEYNRSTGVNGTSTSLYNSALGNALFYPWATSQSTTLFHTTNVLIETTDADPTNLYIYTSDIQSLVTYTYSSSNPGLGSYGPSMHAGGFGGGSGAGTPFLRISNHDKNKIYLGKTIIGVYSFNSLIPINNGYQFSNILGTHADYHAIDFFPESDKMVLANDAGIIFREATFSYYDPNAVPPINDGVQSNTYINGCGLLIAKPYSLWLDERYENSFLIGLQDGHSAYLDQNGEWNPFGGGDGGMSMISPSGGLSYSSSNTFTTPNGSIQHKSSYNQQRRFHPDKAEEEVLAIGGGSSLTPSGKSALFIHKDNGFGQKIWTQYSKSFDYGVPKVFDISESNPDICYAVVDAFNFHTLYKGVNGESTNPSGWVAMNFPFSNNFTRKASRLLIHPHDPNQLWITFGGYGGGNKVFYSSDGGISWQDESGGLQDFPVNSIVMDKNSGDLYIGTDIGVYYKNSANHAAFWQVCGTGLPKVIAGEVRINHNFNKIVVATFGRGIWHAPLECPTGLTNLPASFNDFYKDGTVKGNTQQDNSKTAIIRATNKIFFTPGFKSAPTGNHKLSAKIINCTDPQSYVVDPCSSYQRFTELESDENEGIEKFRSEIDIYPNPNSGIFNVVLEEVEGEVNIQVINSIGSVVLTKKINSENYVKLNIENQPNGFYFVKITSGNNVKVEKIVKK